MERLILPSIDWGVAASALPGHSVSGDWHAVFPFQGGVLVAAVDGLGHGDEAAAAAKAAISELEVAPSQPVISMVRCCHESLRGTRGVVMSLASFNFTYGLMTWLGVGNVEGILLRSEANQNPPEESLLLRPGVLGIQLPPLQAAVLPVFHGDTLILATDGIRRPFAGGVKLLESPQRIAERMLAQQGRGTDDALVLVVRYLGETQ